VTDPVQARAAFERWTEGLRRNAFDVDAHLGSLVRVYGRQDDEPALRAFGGVVSTELDALIRTANQVDNLPRLSRWTGQGVRTEGVAFHPSYHEAGRLAYASGAMARYAEPGHEWTTLALTYLLAQNGEGGHCCPFACTAGLIKIVKLAHQDAPSDRTAGWLERLLDPDYDSHFHGAQFLTEVQGGSDVGANALVARQGEDGGWTLHGEKWFCSVADAQMFLVTARPEGGPGGTRGVMAFAVPRVLDDGATNHFQLRRLKDKLGTRSMASAEIDFVGARAYPVGDFRRVVEVVLDTSRIYNAACSAGMIQRAFREAHGWAQTRMAFGQPILAFPALATVVARLRAEAAAARTLTFRLAHLSDQHALGTDNERDHGAWRMLVNLNKYWTAHIGTAMIRDAIEVLGGNGAIEDFGVLPRLLRDSIVCEAWEGGHNVLCAQALRDSQRLGLHLPMFAFLRSLAGESPESAERDEVLARLNAAEARWERLLTMSPADQSLYVRIVADELRPAAQGAALLAEEAADQGDPKRRVALRHLLRSTDRRADPLEDPGLADRIRALVAPE
jgi:acyl-CoA dehydrogenase